MLAAQLAQGADVAGVAVAEPDVLADHDRRGRRARRRAPSRTNSSGVQPAISRVNSSTSTASRPVASSRASRWLGVGDDLRGVLGAQHGDRVRVEGHRDGVGADGAGLLHDRPEDGPVPEVDAVEVAERHHARAEVGRDLGEVRHRSTGDTLRTRGGEDDVGLASVPRSSSMATSAPSGAKAATGSVAQRRAATGSAGRGPRRSPPPRSARGARRTRAPRPRAAPAVRRRPRPWPPAAASSVRAAARSNGPTARAPQRGQVAADAERGAEVAGEGADVGAARSTSTSTSTSSTSWPSAVDRRDGQHVEPVHRDRAGRQVDVLAGADPRVGALAVDLDRADRRSAPARCRR